MHTFRSQFFRINIVLFTILILIHIITAAPDRQWSKASAAMQCGAMTIGPPTLPDGEMGVSYAQNLTTMAGRNPHTYSISSGALPPGLTLSSGGGISGTPTTTGSFIFTVHSKDANNCSAFKLFTIDINTPCPAITVNPPGILTGRIGLAYSWNFNATGGQAPYTFAITSGALPPGLTFSPGEISGTPTTAGSFTFTLRATDANGCRGSRDYTLTVACPVITINPATLPAGTNGTAYNQTITATGGVGPYSFTISSGTPPPGLSLDSNGKLTGAPTAAGTYNFNVRATDANGCFIQRAYTLTINTICSPITIAPATLSVGQVGRSYSQRLSATGGTAPYTFSLLTGSLPPGLSLAAIGDLSGTPTTAGSFSFRLRATDANGCREDQIYSLTINNACPTITLNPTSPLPSGRIATSYSQTITPTGGAAPYTFSLGTGSFLPAGLTLSTAGLLSGIPGAGGNFSFTIVATDINGCIGFRLYNLFIDPCPLITVNPANPNLPDAIISTPYSATFSSSGGAAPVTLSVAGVLPAGLTLTPATGVLSGSPTQSGTFSFNIRATDANGCVGFRNYTLVVNSTCPTISVLPSNPNLPQATVGAPYNQPFTATGGVAPYLADMFSGSLPNGVTFNFSTGILSGTPTSSGSFTFTVRFRDAGQCPGQRSYTLVVKSATCPSISINPVNSPLPAGIAGTPYSLTFTGSGGTAPYTFRITGGAAPNGLTLSSSGNLTGTPTTAGSFNFNVRATDANGCVDEANYDLVINNASCPGITLNPTNPALPPGTIGKSYSLTFTAIGGAAPYSFSISAGVLPPGSSLMNDGGLTNPNFTSAGNYSFTVRATDRNGCSGERQYSLIVNNSTCPEIVINPSVLSNGVVGTAYSQIVAATGGIAPYSFSVSAGSLPTGLSLNVATGAVTGAPNAPGAFAFTIRATDTNGCNGERAFTVVIALNLVTSVSAASFVPNIPLATESIIAGFGLNMAASTEPASTLPLPTGLAGASLKVKDAAGAERLAPLFLVSPSQINYQVPPGTLVGPAKVIVLHGLTVTAEGAMEIATVSPGLFTVDGSGQGLAAASVLRIKSDGSLSYEPVALYDAGQNRFVAAPIDLGPATDQVFLSLYGTGFKFRSALSAVVCSIGGVNSETLYAGEAPGFAGLDQLNARLSRSLAGRGDVDVVVTVDGKISNTVRVSIR